MEYFTNNHNASVVLDIIVAIQANKEYLSVIDGRIGDGDHGINMNKGFSMADEHISAEQSFSAAMKTVGDTLLLEVGGSMGPIYGTFFRNCASVVRDASEIDAFLFSQMLERALQGVKEVGGAQVGDKTLIDTMEPAVVAFRKTIDKGGKFGEALMVAAQAAEAGKESTRNMMARIGRAARLGERSVGVLDAGATSCCIILKTMFEAVSSVLNNAL